MDFVEKLKDLRKEKGVSQEKLAQFLNVSFQAVSKWENGNACPDITLLPAIARYFGITIDELLQAEKLDEKQRFEEYARTAEELFRNGKNAKVLEIWLAAYKEMPNNVRVREMLMSTYYDIDKLKYKNEIIELGTEICNSDAPMYYKGQAIREIAHTYEEDGNLEMAERWIVKSVPLQHSQEILFSEIFRGDEMLTYVNYSTHWFLTELFYMASRIGQDETLSKDTAYKQAVCKRVAQIYEICCPDDDMDFESLKLLYILHEWIAEKEIALNNEEPTVQTHLIRAAECVLKSMTVTEHELRHPLLDGWHVQAAPSDNKQFVRALLQDLNKTCYDSYRNAAWFTAIADRLHDAAKED